MAANEKTEKTVREVFDTFNNEQKELLYLLVGRAVEKVTGENEDEEPTMNNVQEVLVFDTFTVEQKMVVYAIIDQAVKDALTEKSNRRK